MMNRSDQQLPEYGVYSAFEVSGKRAYVRRREMVLRPLLRVLDRWRVHPDAISFVGWLTSLVFLAAATVLSPWSLVALLLIYLFWDNLDGALAVWQRRGSVGQVVDNYFDLISLLAIVLGFERRGWCDLGLVLAFVGCYGVILTGGFIATFNGLNVLILRVRSFPMVALAGVAVGLWSPVVMPYVIGAGVIVQVVSLASIVAALARRGRDVRFPTLLPLLPLPTKQSFVVSGIVTAGLIVAASAGII